MQQCSCEEYKAYEGVDCPSGYHLCYLCAATITGGTGRFSWNACKSCLNLNKLLHSKYGFGLPLGRHSIMNSISVPLHASAEVQAKAIEQMLTFVDAAGELSEWGLLQARKLFESAHAWSVLEVVAADKWEAKFALSTVKATSRSVQAFKDYLGVNEFEEMMR